MTNADDYDQAENDAQSRASYPPNRWGYVYNLTVFASRIAGELSSVLAGFAGDFAAHNNWAIDRRQERWQDEFEASQRTLLVDDLRSLEQWDVDLEDES